MNAISGKRISFKRKKPNSKIEKCLHNLWLEAKQSNSKHEPVFRTALTSLAKYPLPLRTGADCAILKGFNKALCTLLDQCLESSILNNAKSPTMPEDVICIDSIEDKMTVQPPFKPTHSVNKEINNSPAKIKNIYKPVFRSGSYAILMGLFEHTKTNNETSLKKDDLINIAKKYTDESFTVSKTVRYSAWSSMTRLLNKGLVKKNHSKGIEYSLTEDGLQLANQLWEEYKDRPMPNTITFHDSLTPTCAISAQVPETSNVVPQENVNNIIMEKTSEPRTNIIKMHANTFDVVLLIDKNETHGSNKNDPFSIYPDLMHEARSLKVGDFTWIAKHKTNGTELVLPYIVERKRMDDFAASIKDGRFHEQKFRLRKCGLKNVIYLVESYEKNKNVGLPLTSLHQALSNTRIQDGFTVYATDSLVRTNRFLAIMTKRLEVKFKNKYLQGANAEPTSSMLTTFEYFNKSSIKSKVLTVTEMFIKMLLQLKGMSVEKALAITSVYKTPKSLISAYESCSQKEGEYLLANLKYGDLNRNVGPSVSISIFHLFYK